MKLRLVRMGLIAAVLAAVAGCSSLDLGPDPSDYVGHSNQGSQPLTDPALDAVTPIVQGDTSVGDMTPATSMPAQANNPQTMPAATEPTTTRPAAATDPTTHPTLGQGASSQPNPMQTASGHVAVPPQLSVQDAILTGLQNNISLHVQRFNVPVARTREEAALAAFDPTISGQVSVGRTASVSPTTPLSTHYSYPVDANANITEFLPTGTTITAGLNSSNNFYADNSSNTDASLTVNQALLRGFGIDVNLVQLRSAELNTKITQFELRAFAENLVATIEETYWDLAFAERQVIIVQNALNVAQEQLDSTNGSIKVGRISPTEQAAAYAQVETEKEDLINAKSNLEETRIKFLQSITPSGEPFWNRTISLQTLPFIPQGQMDDVEKHVQVGLRFRPEINETKLDIQQNDLTIVTTKNGLLPQLDFFVNLDKTAYSANFANSFAQLNGPGYSAVAGIKGSYEIGNLAARAAYRASILTRQQTEDSFNNLQQTIQVDVRTQYIEVERLRQQISATRATREADQTSLQVEQAKFKDGRSTSLLVAQAQQKLLTDQLGEVQAVTGHLKSLVELYRLEGSLLYRRGIEAPGAKPIDDIAWH